MCEERIHIHTASHVHVRIVDLKVSRSRHVCTRLLMDTISHTMFRNVYDLHIPFFFNSK
jgi:hypothetical protein